MFLNFPASSQLDKKYLLCFSPFSDIPRHPGASNPKKASLLLLWAGQSTELPQVFTDNWGVLRGLKSVSPQVTYICKGELKSCQALKTQNTPRKWGWSKGEVISSVSQCQLWAWGQIRGKKHLSAKVDSSFFCPSLCLAIPSSFFEIQDCPIT